MKSKPEPILTYFKGTHLDMVVPSNTPNAVNAANASITPTNTNNGASYSAANETTANCVLSPSSIRAMREKEEAIARDFSSIWGFLDFSKNNV